MFFRNPLVWFWAPMAFSVLLAIPLLFWRRREVIVGLRAMSLGFVALALLSMAGWSWLLRDGLGPDTVPSRGLHSLVRFLDGFWAPLLVAAIWVGVMLGLCRYQLTRAPDAARPGSKLPVD